MEEYNLREILSHTKTVGRHIGVTSGRAAVYCGPSKCTEFDRDFLFFLINLIDLRILLENLLNLINLCQSYTMIL